MYGEILDPKKCSFSFHRGITEEDSFCIYITDLEDKSNDDVREVDHPDWEHLWGNDMENVFSPWDQKYVTEQTNGRLRALTSRTEARAWLLSIGMVEAVEHNDPEEDNNISQGIDWSF